MEGAFASPLPALRSPAKRKKKGEGAHCYSICPHNHTVRGCSVCGPKNGVWSQWCRRSHKDKKNCRECGADFSCGKNFCWEHGKLKVSCGCKAEAKATSSIAKPPRAKPASPAARCLLLNAIPVVPSGAVEVEATVVPDPTPEEVESAVIAWLVCEE